jgi:hypothetical protein
MALQLSKVALLMCCARQISGMSSPSSIRLSAAMIWQTRVNIPRFRHLIKKHPLRSHVLQFINAELAAHGLFLKTDIVWMPP